MVDVRLSAKMAHALRHVPSLYGLDMDSDGSVDFDDFVKKLHSTVPAVMDVVNFNNKHRFFVENGRIWAAQGHTIDVNVALDVVETCDVLYHGTKLKNFDSIMNSGVQHQARLHVHLSKDVETARMVADRRSGPSIVFVVDAAKMIDDGIPIYLSRNKVFLTKFVSTDYLVDVIEV